ncbi:MAG: hypothetical protein WBB28_17365 [Crinalium sp.]
MKTTHYIETGLGYGSLLIVSAIALAMRSFLLATIHDGNISSLVSAPILGE